MPRRAYTLPPRPGSLSIRELLTRAPAQGGAGLWERYPSREPGHSFDAVIDGNGKVLYRPAALTERLETSQSIPSSGPPCPVSSIDLTAGHFDHTLGRPSAPIFAELTDAWLQKQAEVRLGQSAFLAQPGERPPGVPGEPLIGRVLSLS